MPFQKGHKINVGKKHPPEFGAAISLRLKDRKFSKETLLKMKKSARTFKKIIWLKKLHALNKGRIPWNKNKKTGLVPKTVFKRGQRAWNRGMKRWWKSSTEFTSEKVKGEKNNNWRGGITPENHRIRSSANYKQWRSSIFERDNYTCQDCGRIGGDLQADHIKPFAYFPKLRFEPSNGRTLCIPCHRKTFILLKEYRYAKI